MKRMNGTTLQALRRLLFFSIDEAASMVGGVTARSWQYWERGGRSIPADVSAAMIEMAEWRESAINAASAAIQKSKSGINVVWYATLDDWLTLDRPPAYWRPHCSVVAAMCARHRATAIPFDGASYREWLGKKEDTEQARSVWASAQT